MKVTVDKLRSFVREDGSGGNPAGVCLDPEARLDERRMSQIARIVGCSETAFIRDVWGATREHLEVLFYKANGDPIPLCGHATIASLALLRQEGQLGVGEYVMKTRAGPIKVSVGQHGVQWYEQVPPEFLDEYVTPEEIADSFAGLPASSIGYQGLKPQAIATLSSATNLKDLLVPVASVDVLQTLQPKLYAVQSLCETHRLDGLQFIVPSSSGSVDGYCRNFSLGMTNEGAGEDAATGTLAGASAWFLHTMGMLRGKLWDIVFHQGLAGAYSALHVGLSLVGGAITNVKVGGRAVKAGKVPVP